MHACTRLALTFPSQCSIRTRCHPDKAEEGSVKVRLMAEAGLQGNHTQGCIGCCERLLSKFDPKDAEILTDRTIEPTPELPREMRRMHADFVRNRSQRQRLGEPRAQQVSSPLKPPRSPSVGKTEMQARCSDEDLECQPFDGQGGQCIELSEFLVEPEAQ